MSQTLNPQSHPSKSEARFRSRQKGAALRLVDEREQRSSACDLRRESAADELLLRIGDASSRWVLFDELAVLRSADKLPVSNEIPLSRLLDKAKILVWRADPESSRFTYVSKQAKKMLGYPLANWYEPDFLSLHLHSEDRRRALPFSRIKSHSDGQFELTFRMHAKDGRIVWVRNLITIEYKDGKPESVYGFMLDISERKRAEEALLEMGGRLITTQEVQRAHIARELHDDFSQRMALLSIELEQLRKGIQEPADQQLFEKLQTQVKELSADIHRLAYRLHPSKLDHLGLGSAVSSLCEELAESSHVKITCLRNDFPAALPKDLELCMFRIAQEAIGNCLKHSGAESIEVTMEKTRTAVRLSVSDNGCGFDTKSDVMRKGLGFMSMKERLHLVGGEMHVQSQPRRGTRIEVSVPLARESKDSPTSGHLNSGGELR